MAIRIFISHASEDKTLVKKLVNALEAYAVISDDEIRCSSLPGYKLPKGKRFSSLLREEVIGSAAIVGVLTPESVESDWLMFELGAGWGAGKHVYPLVAGIDYEDLPGPLNEVSAIDATDRAELAQFLRELGEELSLSLRRSEKAAAAIDELAEEANEYEAAEEDDEEDDDDEDDNDEEDD